MNTDDARHDGPSEVFPWLFLGTIQQAYNLNKKYQGFCRVVNCVGGSAPSKEYLKNLFKNVQNKQPGDIPQHYYKMCVLDDFGKSDLTSKKVDEALDFLEQASKREEKTLVHCRQGINRSTTLVVLYLMKKENMTLREALSFITKKRSQARPHDGYMRQLIEMEEKTKGQSSISFDEIAKTYPGVQQLIEMLRKEKSNN